MAYDESNVFAKVLRGEIPCHRIYEDEDTLAFLDIMPRSEGHALVITKEKARDLSDISPQALAKLMAVVQKLAPKIKEAVGADGVLIQQFNGAAAGQTVFHLHVHIIPRKEGRAAQAPRRQDRRSDQARRHRREDPENALRLNGLILRDMASCQFFPLSPWGETRASLARGEG